MVAENDNEIERIHALAIRTMMRGAREEGRALLNQALALGEASLGSEHLSVLGVRQSLAALDQEAGRYAEAEAALLHILAVQEREGELAGPIEPTLLDLAKLYLVQGRYAEAETLARRVLARRGEAGMGADLVLGRAHRILSAACERQGRTAEAAQARGQSQAAVGRLMAPMFAAFEEAARGLDLENAPLSPAECAELEPHLRRSLAITEHMVGTEHPSLTPHLEQLAIVLRRMGRDEEATELDARARRLRERAV